MIMEAMRLSMVEENDRIRRQQEQERNGNNSNADATGGSNAAAAPPITPNSALSVADSRSSSSFLSPVSDSSPAGSSPVSTSAPQMSSSLPSSSMPPPHLNSAAQHPHRRSFEPSALGGAAASVAFALGAPSTQSPDATIRGGGPQVTLNQTRPSALSTMLGVPSDMATAIMGAGSATPNAEASSFVPESGSGSSSPLASSRAMTPSSSSAATNEVPSAPPLRAAPGPSSLAHEVEITGLSPRAQHSPEASGTSTPTTGQSGTVLSPPINLATSSDVLLSPTSGGVSNAPPVPNSTSASSVPNQRPIPSVLIPRAIRQESQLSLLTPGSVNSETAEEYDFLPSSPQESDTDEVIMHTPLIHDDQEEDDRASQSTMSDSTEDGDEPVRVASSGA